LLGAVHYLVLAGEAPVLALAYAGEGDPFPPFRDVLLERGDWIRHFVEEQGVQTNEVQRCFGLLPGFLSVVDGRPLDVIELGPSAGLNLCWPSYRYRYGAGSWGPAGSALELAGEELPGPPAGLLGVRPAVRRRVGIDLNPVDLTSEHGARLLQAFVWADQTAQHLDRLPQLLADRDLEALTVVFQIASTPYVAEEGRRRIHTALRDAGREGSLAFLNATRPAQGWQGDGYGLELQTWPGERRHIGHLDFHGEWLSWRG
jgi:hypothetical protein